MVNKIYLDSTFGYREDTLRNWQTANPVLERGELSFVRDGNEGKFLKIGDGQTAWNSLPFAPLPKGETGPIGPQGLKGEKGEPGEKGKDAVIDQTFDPISQNAQSGIAVAEALSAVGGEYEHIETITLTEDVAVIEKDKEPNENPYSFKDVFLLLTWGGASTGDYLQAAFTIDKKAISCFRYFATQASTDNDPSQSVVRTFTDRNIRMVGISGASTNKGNITATIDTQQALSNIISSEPISKIRLSRGTVFPANTKIEIWGIRA